MSSSFFFRRAAAAIVIVLLSVPAAASGQENTKLQIKPLGQTGPFFELTLNPGESRPLSVELGNFGEAKLDARTYSADVYTIVNGGFGARLRGEPRQGASLWTDYPESVIPLDSRQSISRTFTLTVPPGTPPGEYVSSLVIENEKPVKGEGNIAINQVQRQALAIAVTVPGTFAPGLDFGGAQHSFLAGQSLVAVELKNIGNIRLKPSGTLVIKKVSGEQVFEGPVVMDSFYAFTETKLETPLRKKLTPGRYTAEVVLEDTERAAKGSSPPLPFRVGEEPEASAGGSAFNSVRDALEDTGIPGWAAFAAAAGLIFLFLLILLFRSRRRDKPGPSPNIFH